MPAPPPVPARGRRPKIVEEKSAETPRSTLLEHPPSILERTYWVQRWEQLNGEEGVGLALSLFLHAILLAAMAIPVYRSLQENESFTTVVQSKSDDQVIIDEPVNTEVALAIPEATGGDELKSPIVETMKISPMMLPNINPSDLPSVPGESQAKVGGEDSGAGSIRIAEPRNAIRAGNFSVWPWPILGFKNRNGEPRLGVPGDPPKVFQGYYIVIRLKVPDKRTSVRLSDFSGEVKGTDGYFQKIPHDAWYFTKKGTIIRARTGRSIPVIDGTAELLIRIPPAGNASVKDSIFVASRLTNEEQKIELQFQPLE